MARVESYRVGDGDTARPIHDTSLSIVVNVDSFAKEILLITAILAHDC